MNRERNRGARSRDRAQGRRYLGETVPGVILTVIPILILLGQKIEAFSAETLATCAVVSVAAAVWTAVGVTRHVRRRDECQRSALVGSFALSFGVAMRNAIRRRHQELGLRRAQLVNVSSTSRQTVNAVEVGRYDPSVPLAFRLADAFRTRVEDIFFPEVSHERNVHNTDMGI